MILGRNIRLRPLERTDLPRFVEWMSDPETRVHLARYMPIGMDQEERWYEENLTAGDTQAWAVDAQPGGDGVWRHIGACGYHHIDWRNRCGEIGLMIGAPEHRGRGFGLDTTRTLVAWGFGTLNLNRVFLRVFADNARAIRCYEKAGFQLEGRLREDNFSRGAYRDTLMMGILRREWPAD